MRRLFGHRMRPVKVREWGTPLSWPGPVKNLRQLSTYGSGAADFTRYKARAWRRLFLHASPPARQAMVDAAIAARHAGA